MTPSTTRIIYPELPDPLTPGDLQQLFSPGFDERKWAPTVTRTPGLQANHLHLGGNISPPFFLPKYMSLKLFEIIVQQLSKK
jgi:hypothetical protein